MKKIVLILSLVLLIPVTGFSETYNVTFKGNGITENGLKFKGNVNLTINMDILEDAMSTVLKDEKIIQDQISKAIKLRSYQLGENSEEKNAVINDIMPKYFNSEGEMNYRPVAGFSGYHLGEIKDGIIRVTFRLVYVPKDAKSIDRDSFAIEMYCSGKNDAFKIPKN